MFNVGDRVRITDEGREEWDDNDLGAGVGVVIAPTGPRPLKWTGVRWDGGEENTYPAEHLEFETISLENE